MTYCLHSPHTVTSSLTLVVLSVDSVDSTAGCSQKQLMIFFFSFSFLRFIFFGWSYRPFVLGQSVPPPPHLPGGFQRNLKQESQKQQDKVFNFHTRIKAKGRKHIKRPLFISLLKNKSSYYTPRKPTKSRTDRTTMKRRYYSQGISISGY